MVDGNGWIHPRNCIMNPQIKKALELADELINRNLEAQKLLLEVQELAQEHQIALLKLLEELNEDQS